MKFDTHQFIAEDGTELFYYTTPRNVATKGVIVIAHGMAEHAGRYEDFAEFLYRKGFITYIIEHRGHGQSGKAAGVLGHFASKDGWQKVINDFKNLCDIAKEENPDLPLIICGHSMGSVIARHCMIDFADYFDAAVILGTTLGTNRVIRSIGKITAAAETIYQKSNQKPSKILTILTFGPYSKRIKEAKTPYDWLNSDPEQIRTYIEDPLCGFRCSPQFYKDFFGGIDYANQLKNIKKMPKDLPILIISGEEDPVGDCGKDIIKLEKRLKKAGMTDVAVHLVPNMRHELHNETNNLPIRQEIADFCLKKTKKIL